MFLQVLKAWWAPSVVFGVLSLMAAFLTLLLPETNKAHLPDTEKDLETIQKKSSSLEHVSAVTKSAGGTEL